MRKITFFTLSTCPACKKVKKFLDDNRVSYSLIEVDSLDSSEQWAAIKELSKHNPQVSYPTVVIEDVVIGNDIDSLKAKLQ
ncbi:MAG TPA: glutaredoxin family protein [Nitrospiraceae bacterium]|nr:glutaredoxin family protein [Nitrospiraceae bacterium]